VFRRAAAALVLGLNHEQQHQELILTDLKHAWGANPLHPVYKPAVADDGVPPCLVWVDVPAGLARIGHAGEGFAFDNELPRHPVLLHGARLASRLVTNGDYLEFMADGGYERPELWLSDGWATRQAHDWIAPLYWEPRDREWSVATLAGLRPLDRREPVCHVSCYEADAYARWRARACRPRPSGKLPLRRCRRRAISWRAGASIRRSHRRRTTAARCSSCNGDVWQWTASRTSVTPAIDPPRERSENTTANSCATSRPARRLVRHARSHARATYRNFFLPDARWQFTGIRLAGRHHDAGSLHAIPCLDLAPADHFRADVLRGLAAPAREIPSKYFYDEAGSRLFDRICELPEYYPTRTELAIMRRHRQEMAALLGAGCLLIEYGSGSGIKSRLLLEQLDAQPAMSRWTWRGNISPGPPRRWPASYPMSRSSRSARTSRARSHSGAGRMPQRKVVYFPGSTVGNLVPEEVVALFQQTAQLCGPGGGMLLGADLKKDPRSCMRRTTTAKA